MTLRYRVSLPGIKGFARVYEMKGNTSLYTFSKQMRADMSFPQDQMVLFKAMAADGSVAARYGMFDLGAGTIDSVTVEQTHKKGEDSFVFFYDTTNAKSVIVTCEGPVEGQAEPSYPTIVESKGPDPIEFENGYVAFEDLPEDKKKDPETEDWDDDLGGEDGDDEDLGEDEDEDEEDSDDEDGAEIYGGEEF